MAKTVQIDLIVDETGAVKGIRAAGQAMTDLDKRVQTMSAKLNAVGTGLTTVGKGLTLGVTAPIAALGALSVKAASDFESSFAGIRKTVDATEEQFAALSEGIRDLSKTIPINVNELNRIGEAAGQLGIPQERLLEFTEVMAKLGVTTNLSSDEAATSLARFANITGGVASTNFETLGNVIVGLGNNFATTEAEIVSFGLRIAGAGQQIGLSQDEILAFGTALSSVGINAEAGGTAISRVFVELANSVASGGEKLDEFARIANMSTADFKKTFETDAAGAVTAFIEGLGEASEAGENVFAVLEDLSLGNVRVRDALLRSANAGDLLRSSLAQAKTEVSANNALTEEAAKRFETFESKLSLLGNRVKDIAITIGTPLIDGLSGAIDAAEPLLKAVEFLAEGFADLPGPIQAVIVGIAGIAAAAGPALLIMGQMAQGAASLTTVFGQLGGTGGIGNLLGSLGKLPGAGAAGAAGMVALQAAAAAATFVIAGEATQAVVNYGRELRGVEDPIADAVAQSSFLEQTLFVLGDAFNIVKDLIVGWVSILGEIPIVGDVVRATVDGLKLAFDEFAKGLSFVGDAVTGFFETFTHAAVEADQARQEAIVNEAALYTASQITGRAITDEAEAMRIVKEEAARLAVEHQNVAQASGESATKAEEDAAATEAAAEAKARAKEEAEKLAEAQKKAAAAAEAHAKAIASLASSLGTSGLLDQATKMNDALALLGKEGTKLTEDGLDRVIAMIEKMKAEGLDLPPQLQEINDKFKAFGEAALSVENLEAVMQPLPDITEAEAKAALEAADSMFKQSDAADISAESMDYMREQMGIASGEAINFGSIIQDLSNIMQAFGLDASSSIGQAVAGIQQLGASLPAIKDFSKSIIGSTSGVERFQAAAGGIAAGAASIAQATSSGGAGISAAKGALSGAAAGGQVAGPIGAGIGAAIGGIVGFFRGRGRAKLQKEIKNSVGATVSEELAKAIKEGAKEAGRSIEQESLLNLGDIISSEGFDAFEGGVKGASDSVLKLMAGIADGTLPAKEGIDEVGEAFGLLAAETFEAGKIADEALLNIVIASKELGQEIPEVAAFIADQLGVAAAGIDKIVGGIQIFDLEDAQAQATILASTFFATVEEVGLLEAVDAFKPAFEELQKQVAELGLGGVDFGGVGRLMEIAGSEQFRPLLEGVAGLNDAMVGLANSGYLTADSFGAFQQQGMAAFEQLTAAGLTEGEALQQLAPYLQSAIDASQRFGFELDENTQSLIAQAEANGIAFETDPMLQMVDALSVIAELLGATDEQLAKIGGTAQETAGAFQEVGTEAGRALGEGIAGVHGEGFIDPLIERAKERLPEEMRNVGAEAGAGLGEGIAQGTSFLEEGLGQLGEGIRAQFGPDALSGLTEGFQSASMELVGIDEKLGGLGSTAQEAVNEIGTAFGEGSQAIVEGLGPVSDKIATEIRDAGSETAEAIDVSFESTSKAIEAGLGEVADTFAGPVVEGALKAVGATEKIAAAAREAARAAGEINFPDTPGGGPGGGGDRSTASGWNRVLTQETRFTAHPGELVSIVPAGQTNALRARGFAEVSAQGGFGGMSIDLGGLNVTIQAPVTQDPQSEGGRTRIGMTKEELTEVIQEIVRTDFQGTISDAFREALFEQT